MAAHLPGMCAAIFPICVIKFDAYHIRLEVVIPCLLHRTDAERIPVATVAINGGANAGILAADCLQLPIRNSATETAQEMKG